MASTASGNIPETAHLGSGPAELVNIGITFLAITWFAVVLRVWARGFIIRSFGWDDWAMLLTMVSFTIQCGYTLRIGFVEMRIGNDSATLKEISTLVTDVIAFTGGYVWSVILLKVSLALFFLRIIIQKWQRKVIIYSLVLYIMYTLAYFGVAVFGCGDPRQFLLKTAEGKCISIPDIVIPMSYTHSVLNAAMDWVYVILPMHTLWHLKIPRSTKAFACALILLGALGSIASLIRITTVKGLNPGRSFFRDATPTMIWSIVEPGLGIAAGSFATLRPMFKRCIESTRTAYGSQPSAVRGKTPDIDMHCKGVSIGMRSQAERAGFKTFDSGSSDVELSPIIPMNEKMAPTPPFERRTHVERNADGIWVQRTTDVYIG